MKIICLKTCTTCKKLVKTLDEKNVKYEYREIDKENPTKEELKDFKERSGLTINKLFNTSGMKYRELGLAKKRKEMSEDQQLDLLATDGMLVKRPILISDDGSVFIGKDAVNFAENI